MLTGCFSIEVHTQIKWFTLPDSWEADVLHPTVEKFGFKKQTTAAAGELDVYCRD